MLAVLPTTHLMTTVVERCNLLVANKETAKLVRTRVQSCLDYYASQRLLELGAERDRLAAERPEGCSCLGTGVNGPVYLRVPDGVIIVPDLKPCECEEAKAFRARALAAQEQLFAERRQERIAAVFRRSGLPTDFDAYSLGTHPSYGSREAIQRVQSFAAAEEGSAFLYGESMRGKTAAACDVARLLVARTGCDLLYVTVPELWERIRATYGVRSHEEGESDWTADDVLEAAASTSLLIMDDLGAERGTRWEQEKLYIVVNARRNARLRTIFTSNCDLGDVAEYLGLRIANRIRRMCEGNIIEFAGPDLLAAARARRR